MAEKGHYTSNPCIYIDDFGRPHLNIFRNFFIDNELPKFKERDSDMKSIDNALEEQAVSSNDTSFIPSWRKKGNTSPYMYENAVARALREPYKKTWSEKFLDMFKKKVSVEDTFDLAKKNLRLPTTPDLQKAKEAAEKLYKFLRASAQREQANKVWDYMRVLEYEIVLEKNGITKYLLENDIIDFMLAADRGVSITYLKYFSNILPLDVAKKVIDINKLLVFDNYAVMFYDPGVDPFRWIKDDHDRKLAKDPILFGMIEDSDKLYYITDWIYQDDDLTMEKVEQVLGRRAQLIKDSKIAETEITLQYLTDNINNMNRILGDG